MGGRVQMYDPPKSRRFKTAVGLVGRSYMSRNQIAPITAPLKVTLDFYFKPPKSYTKKRLQAIAEKREMFVKKPDGDNLAKSVTDGLNNICFKDDAQIVELIVRKHYGEEDYTNVQIEIIEGG